MAGMRAERLVLIILALFTGIMAIVGTAGLLSGAWSEGLPQSWLRGSPFESYTIPAFALFFGVGGSSLLAAELLRRHHPLSGPVAALAGVILVGFEVVEYVVIGMAFFLQPLMTAIGILLIVLGVLRWSREGSGQLA